MKKKFGSIFSIIFILLIAGLLYLNQDWAIRQCDKLRGVYYIHKGDKAYSHLKLQKAIDYYTKGLNLYPQHYTAWFNLGNIYVAYEDYYSAVESYEKAIENNPKMMIARMNYGIISAEKLGDFDGAIAQYDAVIKTKRHLVSIPFIYSNKKSYKLNKGIAYYNKGIAYRQKSLYAGDDIILQREYLSKAIEAYKNAVKIMKKDYDANFNLALAYQLIGDNNNAGLTYCKAIQYHPMRYEAHYNLAILLRHMKYYKEALEEMEKATSLITDSEGMSYRQVYIVDIMNDLTHTIIANEEEQKKIEDSNLKATVPTAYEHGKLVATNALDRAMLKNFKTCGAKKIFLEDDDD